MEGGSSAWSALPSTTSNAPLFEACPGNCRVQYFPLFPLEVHHPPCHIIVSVVRASYSRHRRLQVAALWSTFIAIHSLSREQQIVRFARSLSHSLHCNAEEGSIAVPLLYYQPSILLPTAPSLFGSSAKGGYLITVAFLAGSSFRSLMKGLKIPVKMSFIGVSPWYLHNDKTYGRRRFARAGRENIFIDL